MKITTLPNLDSKPKTPSIGEKVRKARMDCGLSQLELAKQVGLMSSTAICLMEKDERKINARTLRQIAHTTNKPITFFFEL